MILEGTELRGLRDVSPLIAPFLAPLLKFLVHRKDPVQCLVLQRSTDSNI